jgi:hypothetical protein
VRGEAQSDISLCYFAQGDYAACMATTQDALAHVRPGDPLIPLVLGVAWATYAAYVSGHWAELDGLQETLALIWDEVQQVPGLAHGDLWTGYMAILQVALAREDGTAVDAVAALLARMLPQSHPMTAVTHSIVAAYCADDPTCFDLAAMLQLPVNADWVLLYCTEHNLPAPSSLIEAARAWSLGNILSEALVETCEALASGDTTRLAAMIDAAEAGHLVVHAARMRIVLAQRTGEFAPLVRARPVLECLGDQQFLHRLEEVWAALK